MNNFSSNIFASTTKCNFCENVDRRLCSNHGLNELRLKLGQDSLCTNIQHT
jgi:hypothetical protein